MDRLLFGDVLSESDRQDIKMLQGPIFVVGASGFIGAKLFFALRLLRDDVFAVSSALDRSWRLAHFRSQFNKAAYIPLDVTHVEKVNECIKSYRPRTVFNLSAYGSYERQKIAYKIHDVNYFGTLNLMSSLFEVGCDAFVQAGSSSEYGLNCKAPQELSDLQPNSDYSVSKIAASYLVRYYGRIKGFPCAHLRLYSIYGPWEDRNRLIPQIVISGLVSKLPHFVDKKMSRDFVYVDDCIRAFVQAAVTVCKSDPGISLNIASGVKTTLEEVSQISKKLFSIKEEPQFGTMNNRKWDLEDWYGDPSLAFKKMNWKSALSFEDGLLLTRKWEEHAGSILRFAALPKQSKKVSAIVACYRDHLAIPIMHSRLTKAFQSKDIDYEIIFVNDSSPTEDEEIIEKLCSVDSHVVGVSHSRNFGSQSAFLSGMEVSTGSAVILLDGDLQDPPELIPEFIDKWEEGYDVVYGVRVKREAALHMQILYKVFYRLFRKLADFEIPVDAGDFSLISRRVVEQLIKLPEKDLFLRGLRAWVGFKQTGIPYVRPEREFGRTTNSFIKNIWWAKKGIFSFSLKPLAYIQALGVSIFLVSFILGIFYLIYYFISPPINAKGITTVIVLVLGIGGIQLFSLSLLGDYLGKVLEEVKSRPRFIRSKIITGGEVIDTEVGIYSYIKRSKEELHGKYIR